MCIYLVWRDIKAYVLTENVYQNVSNIDAQFYVKYGSTYKTYCQDFSAEGGRRAAWPRAGAGRTPRGRGGRRADAARARGVARRGARGRGAPVAGRVAHGRRAGGANG